MPVLAPVGPRRGWGDQIPVHVVATGPRALHLATASRESLARRFERLTLAHWSAVSFAEVFKLEREDAAALRMGSYPGAFSLRNDVVRWSAYVRDAILEPAIGRDILALAAVPLDLLERDDLPW